MTKHTLICGCMIVLVLIMLSCSGFAGSGQTDSDGQNISDCTTGQNCSDGNRTSVGTVVVNLDVPYIHQCWDTAEWFDGRAACGATCAVMILAKYGAIASHPIICDLPTPHTSYYGWYISEQYTSATGEIFGDVANERTYDYSNNYLAKGAYGYIHYPDHLAKANLMVSFFQKNGLQASSIVSPAMGGSKYPSEADVKNQLDNGYPVVASTYLTAGHIVVIKGYTSDGYYIVNDPYGSLPYGTGICGDTDGSGADVKYTWAQMRINDKWMVTVRPTSTCTNQCTSGAKQCSGSGYQTCGDYNSDGCTEWSGVTNCPMGQVCSNGNCIAPSVILTLYVHSGSATGPVLSGATVTGYDASGTTFSQVTNSAGYVTLAGAPGTWHFSVSKTGYSTNTWDQSITSTGTKDAYLTASCTNQCTSGAKQCSGSGYQTCGDYNSDGCTEWSGVTNCPTGQVCSNGQCIPVSGWNNLGGYVTSSPSVVVDNAGNTEAWVRGGDNALWVNIDGTWLGKGGILTSDPFAVKDYNGKIHVLVRGGDNGVWDFIYDPIAATGHWKGLGGYITEAPTAAQDPMNLGVVRVAVKGGDNALWTCDLNINTETYAWTPLGGSLTSRPYIMFDSSNIEHIFVRGGDNQLWDSKGSWTGSTWSRMWNPLGGNLANGPIATIEPGYTSYATVFAKGSDNALWMCDVYSGSNPETGTWYGFGGVISSDPFAVADTSANKIHVFVRGGDSALWENIFTTSPWSPGGNQWQGIGGLLLAYRPGACIASNTQAFVIGTDHALWRNTHTTFSAASSGGDSSQKQKETNQVNYLAGDPNSGGGKC